jgi:outer membrane biosynthesis protein TonB
MAYQSKYKGVLVHPSDKDTLNTLRALAPSLTEADMMQFLINSVDKDSFAEYLIEKEKVNSLAKKLKEASVKPSKKAAKVEKVDKPVKEKKVKKVKEPVFVATEEETDKVRELRDNDEPPIRVVVG